MVAKLFIDFISDSRAPASKGVSLFFLYFFLQFLLIAMKLATFMQSAIQAILIRKAFSGLIYKKVLRLSLASLGSLTQGRIVNLVGGDL